MTSRNVLLLAVVAVAVLSAALLLTHRETPRHTATATALYPQLKGELDQVTAVRIFHGGDVKAVELTRKGNDWFVSERFGYPANSARVHKLVLALAEAKPVEEKTSNPQNYATLGVEDVSAPAATGVRIELQGPAAPVSLLVGKAAGTRGTYVRRAGEPASWLIDQRIEAAAAPGEWLRTAIVDIGADRVQSVTVTAANAKPYTAEKSTRADADFKVSPLPGGKTLDTFAADGVAGALTAVTLSDVLPAQQFASDKPAAHATIRTFDGLIVDLDGWTKDGRHYVAVKSAFDAALANRFHVESKAPESADAKIPSPPAAPNVEEAAQALNAQAQGWVYEIPDYKYEGIFKPVTALLKK